MQKQKIVLITGAAKRVGAEVARHLHKHGMNIALHYRSSSRDAEMLQNELNRTRENSACLVQGDLLDTQKLPHLIDQVIHHFGRLDVLINNASSFFPTPIGKVTEAQWEDLFGSNLKAPFFLSQAAASHLAHENGCIINMVDIYAQRPLKSYPVYCMAKAGLHMMTKSLAKELGPKVRVNGIAPGVVLAPDMMSDDEKESIERSIKSTALKRSGTPLDVAETILFLIEKADFITGQIIAVDGGRF